MEDATIVSFLDSITSSEVLRQRFLEALNQTVPADTNGDRTDLSESQSGQDGTSQEEPPQAFNDPSTSEGIQLDANECQLGINSSLEANVHQLTADLLVVGDHQPNPPRPTVGTSSSVDPNSLSTNEEFTFNTHEVIN